MNSDEFALNALENAILKRIADDAPTWSSFISGLVFSSRELTGVGSFTNFENLLASACDTSSSPLALDAHISMPGVAYGLGAMLFFDANGTGFLEIFSYGDDGWNGNWEGFLFIEGESKSVS